jgi:hypothetical protein
LKKLLYITGFIAALLLTAYVSFHYGSRDRISHINRQIATTQAMQNFNQLQRYRELENDLSHGCSSEALEKIKMSKAEELGLLASFFKEYKDTWVNKYVSDRDPNLIDQLKVFKSPYGNSWVEPKCANK